MEAFFVDFGEISDFVGEWAHQPHLGGPYKHLGGPYKLAHFEATFALAAQRARPKKVVIPPETNAATRSETILCVGTRAERARLRLRAPKMSTFGDFRQNPGVSQVTPLFTKNTKKIDHVEKKRPSRRWRAKRAVPTSPTYCKTT